MAHGSRLTAGGRLLAVFFPERCAGCGEVVAYGQGFCEKCLPALRPMEGPLCGLCGREESACVCGKRSRYYDGCAACLWYEGVVRRGIRRFKDTGRPYAAAAYAARMAEAVGRMAGEPAFDYITAVPVYEPRRRERGFNPAERLAREVGRLRNIPYAPLLRKILDTPQQKEMPAWARPANVAGVFDIAEGAAVAGKRILLVDDVITTGSTLDECAKMLKIYGAAEVYAVAAAAGRLRKAASGMDEDVAEAAEEA